MILIVLISALILLGLILINHSNNSVNSTNSSNSTNKLKDSDIKKRPSGATLDQKYRNKIFTRQDKNLSLYSNYSK